MRKCAIKLLSFLIFFSFVSVYALPNAALSTGVGDKINLESIEQLSNSIGEVYKKWGSDELAEIIRNSGITSEQIKNFRDEIHLAGIKKIPIPVPFSQEELADANSKLWKSSLD